MEKVWKPAAREGGEPNEKMLKKGFFGGDFKVEKCIFSGNFNVEKCIFGGKFKVGKGLFGGKIEIEKCWLFQWKNQRWKPMCIGRLE